MPTILLTQALANNTYVVSAAFTDEDGSEVTPNDDCLWSLKDLSGNVINSRTAVAIAESTSVDIVLSGDDLAAISNQAEDDGIRVVEITGTYDSDAGSGISLDKSVQFVIADIQIPVTLQDAKAQLNLTSDDTDEDVYISGLIKSARQWVENYTQSKLITQTITKYWDAWPVDGFDIPYGNLQSVTSIKYTDTAGDQSTWGATNYIVDNNDSSQRGRVLLGYNKSYSSEALYPTATPIAVEYVCGYGTTKGDVPGPIKAAIMLIVASHYLVREPFVIGTIVTQLGTVENLLSMYCMGDAC